MTDVLLESLEVPPMTGWSPWPLGPQGSRSPVGIAGP